VLNSSKVHISSKDVEHVVCIAPDAVRRCSLLYTGCMMGAEQPDVPTKETQK
jgi:hypothetical protein